MSILSFNWGNNYAGFYETLCGFIKKYFQMVFNAANGHFLRFKYHEVNEHFHLIFI
jgi:hypothetical protein